MADPMDVQERPLEDDEVLVTLAEAYATRPPVALRERVLSEARREVGARRIAWWRLGGAAAAGAALAALLAREVRLYERQEAALSALARTNAELTVRLDAAAELDAVTRTNAELTARLDEQGRALENLRDALAAQAQVLRILGGPRTLTAVLVPKDRPSGSGRVIVDPASGETAVVISGLEAVSPERVYQLWTLRGSAAPEPAALLAVGAGGVVAARVARIERPGEVTAFAVSLEPAGGSRSPTGPIVLAGPLAS